MPLPELVPNDVRTAEQVCATASQWKIDAELALRVYKMAQLLPFRIYIIDGWRSAETQEKYRNDPNKTAATVALSNHTACPARAVDLRPSITVSSTVKLEIGKAAQLVGLRWGGGADRVDGIPVGNEWRHVDLGPRPQG